MRATVKRVAKRRSKIKAIRPKTGGAPAKRAISPETAPSMSVDVSVLVNTSEDAAPAKPLASGKIVLGASCTIHEAPALRSHLIAQAAHPGPYELDGSAVQQIDTAGLQLIVAFALDCLEKGVHYLWRGRSPALDEAIRTLGVGALLESPGAATNYSMPGPA